MKRIVAFLIFFLFIGTANAQVLNVKLTINNINNNIYIPGTGELSSNSLGSGTTYTNPEHFYIASYLNNLMYALIASSGTSLQASNDAGSHNITINQNLQNSMVLLTFTRGDWSNIDSVISAIEDGSFWQEVSPSISFGLGYLNPVKILLEYADINITGNIRLHSGFRKIIVSNEGFMNEKPIVNIDSP